MHAHSPTHATRAHRFAARSKGFGFVSLTDGNDFARALKEMEGKYIGNRPCQLRKSSWDERNPHQQGGGGGGGKRKAGGNPGGIPGSKRKYHIPIAPKK